MIVVSGFLAVEGLPDFVIKGSLADMHVHKDT